MPDTKENYNLKNDRGLMWPLLARDFGHILYFSENELSILAYSLTFAASPEILRLYIEQALNQ